MKLKQITKQEFNTFFKLLTADFCYEEHKNKEKEFEAVISNPLFNASFININNKDVGYICFWDFGNFIFIEHFAIFKHLRCQGLGTMFCEWFFKQYKKPIIFEVEKPTNTQTRRRINFYKKLNIVFNEFEYTQPSYHNGNDSIPMFIASYKKPISLNEYNSYISTIKKYVYEL